MMMALRQSPTEQFLFQALDGSRPPRRLSRGAMIAIGASIAAHLGLVAYLATQHFALPAQPSEDANATHFVAVKLAPSIPAPLPSPTHQHIRAVTDVTPAPTTTPPAHQTLTNQATLQGVQLNTGPAGDDVTLNPPADQGAARIIVDPRWLSQPSAAELSRFYPERDIDLGLTGRASLMCGVVANGRLDACRVVAETPARAQFGAAALKLVPYFKMSPRTVDGQPVDGGVVKFDIIFNLADDG
jgi:protein TonB